MLDLEWNYRNDIGISAFQALQEYDVWTFPLEKYVDVALEKWALFTEKTLEKEDEKFPAKGSYVFFMQTWYHKINHSRNDLPRAEGKY